MRNHSRLLTQAAIIAALYTLLTHLQNLIFPGTATWAIQCRLPEALAVLALFTPAAIPGMSIGCLIFNLTFAGALPLDWLLGTLATLGATASMYLLRRHVFPALLMPALFNGLLVGWELRLFVGGGFLLCAGYVAAGELIVLLLPGRWLHRLIRRRKLSKFFKI